MAVLTLEPNITTYSYGVNTLYRGLMYWELDNPTMHIPLSGIVPYLMILEPTKSITTLTEILVDTLNMYFTNHDNPIEYNITEDGSLGPRIIATIKSERYPDVLKVLETEGNIPAKVCLYTLMQEDFTTSVPDTLQVGTIWEKVIPVHPQNGRRIVEPFELAINVGLDPYPTKPVDKYMLTLLKQRFLTLFQVNKIMYKLDMITSMDISKLECINWVQSRKYYWDAIVADYEEANASAR